MVGEWDELQLFIPDEKPPGPRPPELPKQRVWTEQKAIFIARYVFGFLMVTRHGYYIDGFAGPQDEGELDAWAASLVLQIEPQWVNRFVLCDIEPGQIAYLEDLKEAHPDRDVQIVAGDFNRVVDDILVPDIIPPTRAAFCLLDQRTFECEWDTVVRVSDYKRDQANKVEVFYFVADWWFARAYGGVRDPATLEKVAKWWGRDDWQAWCSAKGPDRVVEFRRRFEAELGYRFVATYPIFSSKEGKGRVAYYMIHATDHERAPGLMRTAYRQAVTRMPQVERPPLFPP